MLKNRKDVQKFNGFCNFYRQYVRGYSKVARPITRLMGDAPFEWGPKEQVAFEVDASGYALGGDLSQLQDDKWRSVTFISCTMMDAELNYDIYDKELLAIMYALKVWRPFPYRVHHNRSQ